MFNLFNDEKKNLRKENKVLKGKIAILNQENNSLDLQLKIMTKMVHSQQEEIESLKEQSFEYQKKLEASKKNRKTTIKQDKDSITMEVTQKAPKKSKKKDKGICVGIMDSTGIAVIDSNTLKEESKEKHTKSKKTRAKKGAK